MLITFNSGSPVQTYKWIDKAGSYKLHTDKQKN